MDAATNLLDLRSPPANRLEKLRGDRAGQYSIRVNDQWRICFEWRDGHAWNVEIVDYHSPKCSLMKDPALNPIHPGEILAEDFLKPMSLSQYRLAKDIHVPLRRINEIVLGRRGISADTALRLARYFNTTPQFWLNLQSRYELDTARLAVPKTIEKTIRPARPLAQAA